MSTPGPIDADHVTFKAIRSQGPGGQNVNKVATAIQLFFDIHASALEPDVKLRLLALSDQRITQEGVVVIKAQSRRTQELNRQEALRRLNELINHVLLPPKKRRPTRPTQASRLRRLEGKARRAEVKSGRAARPD